MDLNIHITAEDENLIVTVGDQVMRFPLWDEDPWPVLKKVPKRSGRYKWPDAFYQIASAYPEREGGNPWPDAYPKVYALIKEGVPQEDLEKAALNYCNARAGEDPVYTMQMVKFFGRGGHWLEYLDGKVKEQPKYNAERGGYYVG